MDQVSFKKTLKVSSGFAAAMAAVGGCQYAEATIVTVNVSPNIAFPANVAQNFAVTWSTGSGAWAGYNDTIGKTIGASNLVKVFSSGVTINATNIGGATALSISPSKTGTEIIGFKTTGNLLGWFKVNWGGTGGDIIFSSGYINTAVGGTIVAGGNTDGGGGGGGTTVPEPSSAALLGLGGLAMGAVALRRRRQRKADSAA